MLLEAVHVGEGPAEAGGGSHEAVAVGGISIHGRLLLRGRPGGKGMRCARDLHYVSAGLADEVIARGLGDGHGGRQ